jgi:hypothetical protein
MLMQEILMNHWLNSSRFFELKKTTTIFSLRNSSFKSQINLDYLLSWIFVQVELIMQQYQKELQINNKVIYDQFDQELNVRQYKPVIQQLH